MPRHGFSARAARGALALSAALAIGIAACSDATAPKPTGLSAAQAYATLDSVDKDPARSVVASTAYADYGMMLAASGSPVTPITATIDGHAETFNAVAAEMRFDTVGVPRDSAIVLVGWRGPEAKEIIFAMLYQEPTTAGGGYQLAAVSYVQDTTVFDGPQSVPATGAVTRTGGSCAPFAPPDTADYVTQSFQAMTTFCEHAKVAASFTAPVTSENDSTDVRSLSLSLSDVGGIHEALAVR